MPVFVVERYWPGVSGADVEDLVRRLRAAQPDPSRSGAVYLGSVLLVADETVQCRFEASDAAAVARFNLDAGAPYDRILTARAYSG